MKQFLPCACVEAGDAFKRQTTINANICTTTRYHITVSAFQSQFIILVLGVQQYG